MTTISKIEGFTSCKHKRVTPVITTPGLTSFSCDENFVKVIFSKRPIVLLTCQVDEAFCCTEGLYEMKKRDKGIIREVSYFFRADNCTDVIEKF